MTGLYAINAMQKMKTTGITSVQRPALGRVAQAALNNPGKTTVVMGRIATNLKGNMTLARANFPHASGKIMRSGFYDPTDNLSGIFDTLKAIAAPYINSAKGKIGEALLGSLSSTQTKLEAKIGEFLTTGQTLQDIKSRADGQKGSSKPEVKSRAQAISAKANALMNQYTALKSGSLSLVQTLLSLKNQLASDPAMNFTSTAQMGTRAIELWNNYRSKIGSAISESVQTMARIDSHIKETKQLSNDVESLESYAQGKGWGAAVDSLTGFYGNQVSSVVKIAAIGGLVYLLAPTFLPRMLKAVRS